MIKQNSLFAEVENVLVVVVIENQNSQNILLSQSLIRRKPLFSSILWRLRKVRKQKKKSLSQQSLAWYLRKEIWLHNLTVQGAAAIADVEAVPS